MGYVKPERRDDDMTSKNHNDQVNPTQENSSSLVYLARQPIFNADQTVNAYELLYRSTEQNAFQPDAVSDEEATGTVISESILNFGIDEITNGKKAFINFADGFLLTQAAYLLEPKKFTIEILVSVVFTIEVIDALYTLKAAGFDIALDDYVGVNLSPDILDLIDIIKIDFLLTTKEQRAAFVPDLLRAGKILLAEKVETKEDVEDILKEFQPDVVHIFGTEYPHTLAMAKMVKDPKCLLIGMQGLISVYAEQYYSKLPRNVIERRTFRDVVRKDSIVQQKNKFIRRGKNELRALRITGNVTGRTHFDREYCKKTNPDAVYHFMNETMRPCFYEGKWSYDTCRKHQIFYSQADYPIKGLHFVLQGLPKILEKYPDTEVVVAGNNIIRGNGLMDRIKLSSYGKYLKSLIHKNNLQDKKLILCDGVVNTGKSIYSLIEACKLKNVIIALGYAPNVKGCINCNNKNNLISFDFESGGFICANCFDSTRYEKMSVSFLKEVYNFLTKDELYELSI